MNIQFYAWYMHIYTCIISIKKQTVRTFENNDNHSADVAEREKRR